MLSPLTNQIYQLQRLADTLVQGQLQHLGWGSFAVVLGAGLITSLSPCMLSMLPITLGYLGGYEATGQTQGRVWLQSLWFSCGIATTLAGLGVLAALMGRVYGQVGLGLPILVALLAIAMGLNLLNALPIPLPNWGGLGWISPQLPRGVRSYLIGLSFGIAASPCSTPVLATLLAWVASLQVWWTGGALLLVYTLGYCMPLMVAGSFTLVLKRFLALRQWSAWITPTSGVFLVAFGVFVLLGRLWPEGV